MLSLLTRHDIPHPAKVVRIILSNMNHDILNVRKYGLYLIGGVLKQQKRKHKKIQINPREGKEEEGASK